MCANLLYIYIYATKELSGFSKHVRKTPPVRTCGFLGQGWIYVVLRRRRRIYIYVYMPPMTWADCPNVFLRDRLCGLAASLDKAQLMQWIYILFGRRRRRRRRRRSRRSRRQRSKRWTRSRRRRRIVIHI